ncbi:LysM peptidoglycan-binding domain-containing protein [Marinomonas agarivorans]|nr:LysM peptidoglycan-binding domain-containing protein [Marinomonas agarivorans]
MHRQFINKKQINVIICVFLGLVLVGCAADPLNRDKKSKAYYSAYKKRSTASKPNSGYHRVKTGETLYSIAFKYGLDYKKVASLNSIPVPYVIYPNQKIRLSSSVKKVTSSTSQKTKRTSTNVAKTTTKKQPSKSIKNVKKTVKTKSSNVKKASGKPLKWVWPINGVTLKGFSNKGVSSKGIDIRGRVNDKVLSAADGIVVYAGNGLIGYGNLVIVKHNEEYLSAYAHNQKILVKEKQTVKAGQQLAIIGSKGKERSLLHFEVRKDGQPIDPLTVLPKTRK